MILSNAGKWLARWHHGSGPVTKPQGKFFLKIDQSGIEITPFTKRFFYLKQANR